MTSQLTSFVPILDGTNYQQWASSMQSYLMSQGQWKCVKPGATAPVLKGEETSDNTFTGTAEEIAIWNEEEEKALGNTRLRLHHAIGFQYADYELPAALWAKLKEKYRAPGLSAAFIEFKGTMDTVIPNGSDPNPSLDKILAHFTVLAQMKWDIPDKVKAMILLAKAPASMESIVQLMAQINANDKKDISLADVTKAMSLSWETHRRAGAQRASGSGQNQQRAHRLSAVKPSGGPPQFTQQQHQQQREGNTGGFQGQGQGKGRRGKRGGQRVQQQLQAQQTQGHQGAPPQFQPQPPQWAPATPAPQYAPQFAPPPPPKFAAGPSDMGYLASKAIPESFKTIFKANPDPPLANSPYPPFNRALSLARRLGVHPSIETIKTLEINEIAKARKEEQARPNKRPQATTPIELPRGRALGQEGSPKGKERAKDDEVVSLYSEDETMADVDPQNEEQVDYGHLDTQDYNLDGELADLAGIYNDYWQVQSPETNQGADISLQQLGTLLVSCNISCLPCSHECDCKTNEPPTKEWILDSGASLHFTNDVDDFIDYEEIKENTLVRTANPVAQIIGKGTVILALTTGEIVRIYPVYHIPSLTCRLLSMGTFLKNGLKVLGSSQMISLEERSNPFLTFAPRSAEDTIYII